MNKSTDSSLGAQTIRDFGEQWIAYPENEGVYASLDTLQDLVAPFDIKNFENSVAADIGSGSGRIVNMLLAAGAKHVYAVEPSDSFTVLKENTSQESSKITYLKIPGDEFNEGDLDYVVSFGVIHHIPDPGPTMRAIHASLKQGGKAIIWVYGKEGNRLYLFFVQPLRLVTKRLPHWALQGLSKVLNFFLGAYIRLCKHIRLPMHKYMTEVLGKWTPHIRFITIYDQLNPAYAKYYTREEALRLLEDSGFHNISIFHRHGYSWTIIGEK